MSDPNIRMGDLAPDDIPNNYPIQVLQSIFLFPHRNGT